ncbi:MAG: ATP-dependent helicase [Parcubacteria group bacterium]|nr:ATP-dependent helicase [Parcubacteria group bacterium]
MKNRKFEELYGRLNPKQKAAVDAIDGPVMVVAGPGTGKTEILTLRIANILLKTDIGPAGVLALTFTESGAVAMRRRLVEIIGAPAYYVNVSTFHGFCNGIIRDNPDEFPSVVGAKNLNEVEQIKLVEKIVAESDFQTLKPFGDPFYYVRSISGAIQKLKRESVTPEKLAEVVKKEREEFERIEDLRHEKGVFAGKIKGKYQELWKYIERNGELAAVYAAYREALQKDRRYDYSDMILEVVAAFEKNRDFLLRLQETHQYILVDEHQDTNSSQNRILELLCGFYPNPNLFVVGDEKQAIFRFQGASLENFLYFQKIYPEAVMITLNENYRSTQTILDSAGGLIAKNRAPDLIKSSRENLKAGIGGAGEMIAVRAFTVFDAERHFLAADIKKKISEGVRPAEIAVLYRDNKDVFPVVDALEKASVPFAIESDQNVLRDGDVKKLLALFNCVGDFGNDEKLIEAMHADFLGIAPLDVYKTASSAFSARRSLFELISDRAALRALNLENPEKIYDFYRALSRWKTAEKNETLSEFFGNVLRESGLLASILQKPDCFDKLDKINALFGELRSLLEENGDCRLSDFLAYLNILKEYGVVVKRGAKSGSVDAVRLMTAHGSKGLEFDCVYVINAYDGHWGNKRRAEHFKLPTGHFGLNEILSFDANEDERRLFYVALTRARKNLTITYSERGIDGREQLPSQFIEEIDDRFKSAGQALDFEEGFLKNREIIFSEKRPAGAGLKDKEFFGRIFAERGLSATSFNNYLDCPRRYFYLNLLMIPRGKNKQQNYGTAVHEALNRFFKARDFKKESLLVFFEAALKKEPLAKSVFDELLAKGRASLAGYYDYYRFSRGDDVLTKSLTEVGIKGVILAPGIILNGKIDRIDPTPDGAAVVIDYKTSKPKSRNFIEGKTKGGTGDIKRQLIFYKILLDRYENGKTRMAKGRIDFVEPDEKGRYRAEEFVITDGEAKELEDLIKKTAEEIRELKFWDRRCDDKECEFCALRDRI